MKKIALILLTALLFTILTACDFDTETSDSATTTNANETTIGTNDTDLHIMGTSGTIDDYVINIKSIRLTTNYEDAPSVIVTYDFTNNGEDAKSFMLAVTSKVFQDGIECESTISAFDDDSFNSENQMKDIKTGATLEVEKIYKLNNETSEIEVEVSKLISFSKNDPMVVRTFQLTE